MSRTVSFCVEGRTALELDELAVAEIRRFAGNDSYVLATSHAETKTETRNGDGTIIDRVYVAIYVYDISDDGGS